MRFTWEPEDVSGALVVNCASSATNNRSIVVYRAGEGLTTTVALVSLTDGLFTAWRTKPDMAELLTAFDYAPIKLSDAERLKAFGRGPRR